MATTLTQAQIRYLIIDQWSLYYLTVVREMAKHQELLTVEEIECLHGITAATLANQPWEPDDIRPFWLIMKDLTPRSLKFLEIFAYSGTFNTLLRDYDRDNFRYNLEDEQSIFDQNDWHWQWDQVTHFKKYWDSVMVIYRDIQDFQRSERLKSEIHLASLGLHNLRKLY